MVKVVLGLIMSGSDISPLSYMDSKTSDISTHSSLKVVVFSIHKLILREIMPKEPSTHVLNLCINLGIIKFLFC